MRYQRFLPHLVFLILTNFLAYVRGQPDCLNNGNYTNNSTYQANLNTLLSALSKNIDSNGFYNASAGQSPDRVNAFVLCRGDTQLETCRSCVQNITADIVQSCPNYRQAIRWFDLCWLRYSDDPIIGIVDLATAHMWMWWSRQNVTDATEFKSSLNTILYNLRLQASKGGSLRKVAFGNTSTSGFQTIYAFVQCTPDLSQEDCISCLSTAAQLLPGCCDSMHWARIYGPSCDVHYSTQLFYNETRLLELASMTNLPSPLPAVPLPPPPPPPPGKSENNNKKTNGIIAVIVVSVAVGVALVVLIGFLLVRRMNQKPKGKSENDISIIDSVKYDFGVIRASTNDFSDANKLGQGGFGAVYRGKLPNNQEIAVKRLSKGSGQGDVEFKNEVMLLARLQHRNLVRLFGFSLEGQEKLLIYELVQNASLDKLLFDLTKRSHLDWDRRHKIMRGIARGILYLHEDSCLRIIHRDLKAGNVLLDGDLNPKIADFGMARLFVPDETRGSTSRIVGTYGYMTPEYATRGHFSVKSDVFSFGVLLLEIISGERNNFLRHGETEDLISNAWRDWCKGTVADLIDPALRVTSSTRRDILRCIHIGLLCVQENATDRPTMASVVIMLNSPSMYLPVPSRPPFHVHRGYTLLPEFNTRRTSIR